MIYFTKFDFYKHTKIYLDNYICIVFVYDIIHKTTENQ